MLFHEELFTRSQCTCCQQEITGVGIECVECHNGNLRLCCECFTLGAEVGQHKADHKYRFFDSGSLVLGFKPNNAKESSATQDAETEKSPIWSAREEIRLLDAIEQYGFGNWQDISKHIETKTPAEAKTEYVNRYVVGTLGELTWPSNIPNEVNRSICNSQIQKPVDHTVPCDDGPLSPSLTQRLPPLEITPDEMLQLVYMPNRDDYEKEYDNEAEKLVSQLSFTAEDEEVEIGLKLALVDMYARRLRERARRKRMIRDYQLVSKFFKKDKTRSNGSSLDPLGTKESFKGQFAAYEKNLQEKLRPFAQFHNSREFEHLIRNLVKEKEMKHRLTELYKYRSNGIRRLDDCSEFERIKGLAAAKKQSLETISENQEKWNKESTISRKFSRPFTSSSTATGASVKFTQSQIYDAEQHRKRRKRRRKPLCRPKSHTAAVLQRRIQLKKLHGIKRIGTCFIASGSGRSEESGNTHTTLQRKLIPTKRKTKGFGRPIYC
ncbi:unnamed protein product [Orchesella dallaii]|uniref:Transcriptional adapter n=1 Tax=Orchesella dallaii TaxID=48710 RepID=A0ABP1RDM0_9HEXA